MDKLYAEIGGRMKTLRMALKLTQAQVAELAGIDTSFYGQLERGKNIPSVRTLIGIASALKAEPADLLPTARDSGIAPAHAKALETLLAEVASGKRTLFLGVVSDIAKGFKK